MNFLKKLAGYLPFNNSPAARWAIVAFLVALLVVMGRCKGDELDLSVGREIVHGNGAAIGLYYRHDLPIDIGSNSPLRLFVGTDMVASDGLGDQSNWIWAAGLEGSRGYLHMGIGASYVARTSSLIGQHADYQLYIRYTRWKWCPIYIRHYSDAGTSDPNVGINLVGCEWKLR